MEVWHHLRDGIFFRVVLDNQPVKWAQVHEGLLQLDNKQIAGDDIFDLLVLSLLGCCALDEVPCR